MLEFQQLLLDPTMGAGEIQATCEFKVIIIQIIFKRDNNLFFMGKYA